MHRWGRRDEKKSAQAEQNDLAFPRSHVNKVVVSRLPPGLSASDGADDCESCEGGEERDHVSQILVLDMGDLQLGAVGTSLLRVRNEGALPSQYMLYPIVLDVTNLQFPISRLSETETAALEESQDHPDSEGPAHPPGHGSPAKGDDKPQNGTSLAVSDPHFLTQSNSAEFQQQLDMISVDKLVMSESFSESKHTLLSTLGIADLVNQWSYEPMNLQHFVIENSSAVFEARQSKAIRMSYAPSEPGDFYSILFLKIWNPLVGTPRLSTLRTVPVSLSRFLLD